MSVLACALSLAIAIAPRGEGDAPSRAQPWSPRTIELAGSLAVQEGGRVKPASTFARFALLRISGGQSLESVRGESLSPVEWLLDVMLYPEDAAREKVFLVQDSDAVAAIGLDVRDKKKRDRWSYEELQPGMPRLFTLAHDYDAIPEKERGSVQGQVVLLAGNVMTFLRLARELDPVREGAAAPIDTGVFACIPPDVPIARAEAWATTTELATKAQRSPEDTAILASLAALVSRRADPAAFETELSAFSGRLAARAHARGEGAKIALERFYYASHVIGWSLAAFLASFLVACVLWLRPTSRSIHAALFALVAAGVLLLVGAIAVRCVIRGRPPVSTLYESVLFVTAVGGILALFLESIHRNRIAVSAASVLGVIGLFIANGYETLDKQDTMPSLVAVLDTNFWLATHVTAITIGYSAGLLAALLASVYLVAKLVGFRRADPSFGRSLARMVYGVLCFAVIFSTVGTILGGIWANESWGRFWGWDPKENGALLIVISQLAILHARMSGWLREHGICTAAALGGTVIAFSWWGVNLLGVGLHSYGFTSGVHTALWSYYWTQWSVVALGGIAWRRAIARREPVATQAARLRQPNRTESGQAA
ncbi:MAG TPA: cytochrome c biogenesis protein CcsA [Planctomycetota bacterium]|nr:cytochrome c biogenesis protein CcsA [Planctomycetota bacterium]